MMLRLTAGLVVYRTPIEELTPLLRLLEHSCLRAWVVVDNAAGEHSGKANELRSEVEARGGRYVASIRNVGFGAGHNIGLRSLVEALADYHLMLNPDIMFGAGALETLQKVMDERVDVGLLMPRVTYPDGEVQRLCKLLPTPIDFFLRRFAPRQLQSLFSKRLAKYEMRGIENTACESVPFLSGCFMFTRLSALNAVNGFDERYFLYMEDVDLCRRMASLSKLLYWPGVTVTHGCYRGAYKNRRLMWLFVQSAVRYFKRWGWFFDKQRRSANRNAISCILRRTPAA